MEPIVSALHVWDRQVFLLALDKQHMLHIQGSVMMPLTEVTWLRSLRVESSVIWVNEMAGVIS